MRTDTSYDHQLSTIKKYILWVVLGIICPNILPVTLPEAKAQDPQFTQFYAAPIYLNPAFAGSTGEGRLIANYRNQWPGLGANFVTYAFSYDQFFPLIRSSFGVILKRDELGGGASSPFLSTDAAFVYAYLIPINDQFSVQAGIQGGYGFRDLNFNRLVFGDQISESGPTGTPTGESLANERIGFFDASTGVVLYSNQMWFGLSMHHINQPNLSFMNEADPLPRKFSAHAGYRIPIDTGPAVVGKKTMEASITPTIMYMTQGTADQLSVGSYFNYGPMVAGFWYRGLPIKRFQDTGINQDAIALMLGFQMDNISFGYSYDYTVSQLSNINTLGSHEISVIYNFRPKQKGKKKGYGYPKVTCPNPWKRYERLNYQHVPGN